MYNKPEKKKEWVTNPFSITGQIQLKKVEEFQVVYIRHTGNYTSLAKEYARLMENLFRAAAKQKLLKADENQVLAMYHDNPEFGKEEQFRTSLCITVPKSCTAKEDGIAIMGNWQVKDDSGNSITIEFGSEIDITVKFN